MPNFNIPWSKADLTKKKVANVKKILTNAGLSTNGKKDVLIKRYLNARMAHASASKPASASVHAKKPKSKSPPSKKSNCGCASAPKRPQKRPQRTMNNAIKRGIIKKKRIPRRLTGSIYYSPYLKKTPPRTIRTMRTMRKAPGLHPRYARNMITRNELFKRNFKNVFYVPGTPNNYMFIKTPNRPMNNNMKKRYMQFYVTDVKTP